MTETSKALIAQCIRMSEKFDLPPVKEIVDTYIQQLNEDRFTITLVDLGGASDKILKIARSICSTDDLYKYEKLLREYDDWSISIEYGDEETIFCEPQTSRLVAITVPNENLKNKKIFLYRFAERPDPFALRNILSSEKLVLLTNAEMPLARVQKEWFEECVADHYDLDRFSVYISGLENLLDEKQEDEVFNYVKTYFQAFAQGDSIAIIRDAALRLGEPVLDRSKTKAEKCALRNLVREIEPILEHELECAGVSAEEFDRVASELQTLSWQFLDAGEVSANNVLSNQISAIIDAVSKSAEEYSDSMYCSIKRTILGAKEIDDVESRIAPYMERSWEYFSSETSKQLSKDFERIQLNLTQRMEQDIEALLQKLDVKAQSTLGQIFDNNIPAVSEIRYAPTSFASAESAEKLKNISRNARNLMILSVPLLFVSPTLSVVTLLGGGIYSKLEKKTEDCNYRKELDANVEKACKNARRTAVEFFAKTLDGERQRMKQLVMEGYQNLLDGFQKELRSRKEQVDKNNARAAELREEKQQLHLLMEEL